MKFRKVSFSEFLRAVKRSPLPTVHHNLKTEIWIFKTNKCIWFCRFGHDSTSKMLSVEFGQYLAKIKNITFHHYGA